MNVDQLRTDIEDLKMGDFMKQENSNIELKVVNLGSEHNVKFVELYNDVTNTTKKLIDITNYNIVK
jgi:hypothetical protein